MDSVTTMVFHTFPCTKEQIQRAHNYLTMVVWGGEKTQIHNKMFTLTENIDLYLVCEHPVVRVKISKRSSPPNCQHRYQSSLFYLPMSSIPNFGKQLPDIPKFQSIPTHLQQRRSPTKKKWRPPHVHSNHLMSFTWHISRSTP